MCVCVCARVRERFSAQSMHCMYKACTARKCVPQCRACTVLHAWLYTYTYIHICMYMYVYAYSIYMLTYIYTYIHIYRRARTHIYMCMHGTYSARGVRVCVPKYTACTELDACIHTYICILLHMYIYANTYKCIHIYTHVCVHMCMYIHICICVCTYIHMCIYIHMHVLTFDTALQ